MGLIDSPLFKPFVVIVAGFIAECIVGLLARHVLDRLCEAERCLLARTGWWLVWLTSGRLLGLGRLDRGL